MKTSCEEFEAHIVHFLNGELEEELVEPLKVHLDSCEPCRRMEAEYRFLMETAASLPLEQVSGEINEKIIQAVAKSTESTPRRSSTAPTEIACWRSDVTRKRKNCC